MSHCGFITLLNDIDINTWFVETTVKDIKTGKVVWYGFWPDDKPTIDPDDFSE